MSKKILALLLSVLMVVSLFPMSAAAAGPYTTMPGPDSNGDGNTITLDGNVNLTTTWTVTNGQTRVLDLNGNTVKITAASGIPAIKVEAGATLTIKDSKTGGLITRDDGKKHYVVFNNGTTTLKSGKIKLPSTDSSAIINRTAKDAVEPAKLNIEGGEVESSYIAIKNDSETTVTNPNLLPVLTISGGEMTTGQGVSAAGADQVVQNWGVANISAGTFHGCVATWINTSGEVGKTTISGGSFDMDGSQIEPAAVLAVFALAGATGTPTLEITEDANITVNSKFTLNGEQKDIDVVGLLNQKDSPRRPLETVDGATASINVAGGNYSKPLPFTSYLDEELQYEANSKTGSTPYSYHKTVADAAKAAGAYGEVTPVVDGDKEPTDNRVRGLTPNGGTDAYETATTYDAETKVYEVVITGDAKPSSSEESDGADYWIGVGVVAPEGYTKVEYAEGNYWTTSSLTFKENKNAEGGPFDYLQKEGEYGFALWPSANLNGTDGLTRTLKWTAADMPDYYEVYHFTWAAVKKEGALVTLEAVGYAYKQTEADAKANAAFDAVDVGDVLAPLGDVYKNTMWATFKRDGKPTKVTVTFVNGEGTPGPTNSYKQEFTQFTEGAVGGIAYFSFEEGHGGASIKPVEGKYTITLDADGVVDKPQTLELYKVTVDPDGGEWGEGVEVPADYYTTSDTVPQAELPSIKPTKGGKTASGWNQKKEGYVITLTPKWPSNSGGVSTPDDDDTEDKDFDYSNCPKDSNCPVAQFKDASVTAWYHNAVHFCLDNGLMSGNGDGTFSPSGTLNRATVVQLLYNMEGKPSDVGPVIFSDVPATAWYSDAVRWAASNDIVAGNGDGTFSPESPITREQMAVIFRNFAQNYEGRNVNVVADLANYTDTGKISRWALSAMQWAVGSGLMSGTSSTTLAPLGTSERAQAASVLMKYCLNIAG